MREVEVLAEPDVVEVALDEARSTLEPQRARSLVPRELGQEEVQPDVLLEQVEVRGAEVLTERGDEGG